MRMKDADRFWSKVDKRGPTDCWMWTGAIDKDGYGVFWLETRNHRAHRASYELSTGTRPNAKLYICHSCDTPGCVNPRHLWLGSAQDNSTDAVGKARLQKGERHYACRLTDRQVAEIRAQWAQGNTTQTALAAQYGVHQTMISLYVLAKRRT